MKIDIHCFAVLLAVSSMTCALAACGDDSGKGGSGGSGGAGGGAEGGMSVGGGGPEGGFAPVDWNAYCDARAATCETVDATDCKASEACARASIKDEIEDQLLFCLERQCSKDSCVEATLDTPLTAQGQSMFDACQAYVEACPDQPDAGALCYLAYYIADEVLADIQGCIEGAQCADAGACLEPVLDSFDQCSGWL